MPDQPQTDQDRNAEVPESEVECSSPPCYAHELDPAYRDLIGEEGRLSTPTNGVA